MIVIASLFPSQSCVLLNHLSRLYWLLCTGQHHINIQSILLCDLSTLMIILQDLADVENVVPTDHFLMSFQYPSALLTEATVTVR